MSLVMCMPYACVKLTGVLSWYNELAHRHLHTRALKIPLSAHHLYGAVSNVLCVLFGDGDFRYALSQPCNIS